MKTNIPILNKPPAKQLGESYTPKRLRKNNKYTFRMIYISIISVFLIVLIASICLILACSKSVTVEVGDTPDYSHITSNGFVSLFCKVDTDISSVDTSKPQESEIPIMFFGFIKGNSTLRIVDTVKPKITPQNVCITAGTEITGDMFVREIYDKTKVTFDILTTVNSTEDRYEENVSITATDEGGNSVEFEAKLTVIDPKDTLVFEYGVTIEEIETAILSVIPQMENIDFSMIDGCGQFLVTGKNDNTAYFAEINISDTKAPVADVNSFDILLGEQVFDDDIVKNITDHSEVTTEFLTRADFETAGEHNVKIRLTDSFGNSSEYTSYIRIHDVKSEITAEIMSSNTDLSDLVFNDEWSKDNLSFGSDYVLNGLGLGKHEISLIGKYNSIPISVNLIDTVAPVFTVKAKSYLVGNAPSPADFVSSCSDATDVTYSFKTIPDSSKEGTFDVTITATDTSNNSSERTTNVTFFYDVTPPVISGHKDIIIKVGQSCNYGYGVTAWDSVWGTVNVNVDSSAVDINTPGTYSLVYTATDGSGNTAKETVTVTVTAPTRVCLNVTNIMQKPALPNGCEVVSLAIALKYAGFSVDPVTLYDKLMPKSPFKNGDPWTTYVGDAKGKGYGCYAPCVVTTGNAYLASVGSSKTVSDVSGQSLSYYESLIDRGTPVIMWGTVEMNGNSKVCWEATINGKYVKWHNYSHCLVLIGYTDNTYIFCDPLRGVVEYTKSSVEASFGVNYKQACIVK